MILFHLSHTDLDGYACQYLSNKYFSKDEKFFYNANYGVEVKTALKQIPLKIQDYPNDEILFLISDLNLTLSQSKTLDEEIKSLQDKSYNITLQVLDHHISGEDSAKAYSWYFLDDSRCAAKICLDYFLDKNTEQSKKLQKFSKFISTVNAADIWLEDEEENFEFGKVCMSMTVRCNEINPKLFPDENRKMKFWMYKKASKYLDKDNANILFDNKIHKLKKTYLKKKKSDDTLDNLSARNLVELLGDKKEILSIKYKNHKGLMTYCLGNISIPANAFLKENEDYDFFIDLSYKGTISLRADSKLDVCLLASKLANGGGHKNAAGGKFDDFDTPASYEEARVFLQEKLDKIKD